MGEEMLSDTRQVNIVLSEEAEIHIEIGSELVITRDYQEYTGTHTVTPSSVAQTLFTADKYVRNNINVKEIPYAEVSNAAGGNTVTIG